jgi:hypothetical protein
VEAFKKFGVTNSSKRVLVVTLETSTTSVAELTALASIVKGTAADLASLASVDQESFCKV